MAVKDKIMFLKYNCLLTNVCQEKKLQEEQKYKKKSKNK